MSCPECGLASLDPGQPCESCGYLAGGDEPVSWPPGQEPVHSGEGLHDSVENNVGSFAGSRPSTSDGPRFLSGDVAAAESENLREEVAALKRARAVSRRTITRLTREAEAAATREAELQREAEAARATVKRLRRKAESAGSTRATDLERTIAGLRTKLSDKGISPEATTRTSYYKDVIAALIAGVSILALFVIGLSIAIATTSKRAQNAEASAQALRNENREIANKLEAENATVSSLQREVDRLRNALTPAEADLLALVPSGIRKSCTRGGSPTFSNVTALQCKSSSGVSIYYHRFDSRQLLDSAFGERFSGFGTGDCNPFRTQFWDNYRGSWNSGDVTSGELSCQVRPDGLLIMEWTNWRTQVYGIANVSKYSDQLAAKQALWRAWQEA